MEGQGGVGAEDGRKISPKWISCYDWFLSQRGMQWCLHSTASVA